MKKLLFTLVLAAITICGISQNPTIDPLLAEEMSRRSDTEKISVTVIMKQRYDRELLNRRASYFVKRADRRSFVVNELKQHAEATQYDLKLLLKEMQRHDMTTEPKTLWISNALCLEATKAAIMDLSRRSDIEIIGYNIERIWIPDGETSRPADNLREITSNVLQVNANQVWDMGYTGQGILVAVVDTGINYNHLDLADHLWDGGPEFPNHGYDVKNGDNDPMDDHGHGTHCSGTVCGDGTAGSQTGMAPDATLMGVKCVGSQGEGDASNIASGIEWAVEHNCDMFSMSLGISGASVAERVLLRRACDASLEAGIVGAIAAGNDGGNLGSYPIPNNVGTPGSCPPPYIDPEQAQNPGSRSCSICIGAVDSNDAAAYFSSRGPVTWADTEFDEYPYNPGIGLIRPDVCAPGVDIKSADHSGNNGYTLMSGTSMATPCAAGCIALILSKNPNLTPEEVCQLLEETAFPLSEGKSNVTGFGRIDVKAAIENISTGPFTYCDYTLHDEDGNNNHQLNPGETVSLDLTVANNNEMPFDDVTFLFSSSNENVNITSGAITYPHFEALDTVTMPNALTFELSENAMAKSRIAFVGEAYVADTLCGKLFFSLTVYDDHLQYGAIAVLNDDNGDGLLEPGENADLRIFVDNKGNEAAPTVMGTLSSTFEGLTIHETTKPFGTIGPEMTSYADFNVSLDASVPDDFTLPLELNLVDADGKTTLLAFEYRNACNVIFTLHDILGFGWYGSALEINYADGTMETLALSGGTMETYVREMQANSTVTLTWHSNGFWDYLCSFEVAYEDGRPIYENSGSMAAPFSFVVNCNASGDLPELCGPVQNLNLVLESNNVTLTWEAPAEGTPTGYEVYRNDELLGTVNNMTYTDSNVPDGTYNYCVLPTYADCQGSLECEQVEIDILGIEDLDGDSSVSIFPNPTSDNVTIECAGMEQVQVYTLEGQLVQSHSVRQGSCVINGLDNGIYLLRIIKGNETIMRRIVKR